MPTVSYTRGHDLSGSLEGAGGIGGLLARSHGYSGGSWANHNVYHADGGGNVTYLMTSAQGLGARSGGRLVCRRAGPPARRQGPTNGPAGVFRAAGCRPLRQPGRLPLRNPYGRLLSSGGPLAGANRYRFASKEVNPNYPDAGGYYYFGYRFYDPNLQRWFNRDPLGEAGGINLYGFVGNDPMNFIDPSGWDIVFVPPDWQGPPAAGDTIVPCPEAPPEVSLQENMTMAESHGFDSVHTWGIPWGKNYLAVMLVQAQWFRNQVKEGGSWDYKRLDPRYENFGNFNYGATGSAFGFDPWMLQNEAGIYQQKDPRTKNLGRGDPGNRFLPGSGVPPYGDQPTDNEWVKHGIEYHKQYPPSKGPGPCG